MCSCSDDGNMCYPTRENSIDDFLAEMVKLLNGHDRGIRTMSDPEWLEIIGHPTIPHVQSLRAPPAQVALHSNKENLIGLASRNQSKRYLEKLQKERERNQEVLTECVDNLPIVIRQMVYPEKPSPKQPWRLGDGHSATSGGKRFRVGKHPTDSFWKDNIEQWVQSEHGNHAEESARNQQPHNRDEHEKPANAHDRKHMCSSHNSENTGSVVLSKEFVHHQGFLGSQDSQSTNLKYKFGKKKASTKENNQPSTFKPKGFGSLYDELEFERRYKKVFDLNKHIHFVHSNFVSGQRVYKRNKLPPIGHIPSIGSDPTDSQDIFAIMSVQRFNHPDDTDFQKGSASSTGRSHPQASDGISRRHQFKRSLEISQDLNVPVGFVPGTIKSTGNSPFAGVNGNVMQKEGCYRLSMASRENDSALGTLSEDTSRPAGGDDLSCSERSAKSVRSRGKIRLNSDDTKPKHTKKNRVSSKERGHLRSTSRTTTNTDRPLTVDDSTVDEQEPFNITVHVEIKPKDPYINGGDDVENEKARERELPVFEHADSPDFTDNDRQNEQSQDRSNKVLYSTRVDHNFSPRSESTEDGLKVIRPKNIATTSNQFGFVTNKVQYPDRFVLRESLVEEEEDENEAHVDNSYIENNAGNENNVTKTDSIST
ncbi:uncharacterized protein LOC132753384 isoform X1 [Ruditapes philippinarum]|uniref:uncharacterized protein LOC132753384 isoform X1 n=1 Tax=Ruditapes philippinarum TaxID=129788 RepID=UPI00295BC67E|nr:uncharacterized protein LOC132753384 isoform X1 [Ruditapes philippinarum]